MGSNKAVMAKFRKDIEAAGIRPERIILFGSRARGDALKSSDYDVVIVSNAFEGIPFPKRLMDVEEAYTGVEPIESLAYTLDEFEAMKKKSYVVAAAAKEGLLF